LDVYFKKGTEESTVYEDGQDGFDYKKGRYSLRNFKLRGKDDQLIIQQFKDGTFITSYETIKLKFHGLPFQIKTIQVDNEVVTFEDVKLNGSNSIELSKEFTVLELTGM
jgi:alpha-glucosidase